MRFFTKQLPGERYLCFRAPNFGALVVANPALIEFFERDISMRGLLPGHIDTERFVICVTVTDPILHDDDVARIIRAYGFDIEPLGEDFP